MYQNHPLNDFYKAKIAISDKNAVVTLVLKPKFHHAASAVHGSVYWKLLDDSAFLAVNSMVEDVFVLTASFTIYLIRPITTGTLIAKGKLANATRSQFIGESILYSDQEEEIARGTGVYIRSRIPLSPEVGYL
ncbi:thioesterase [Candidatus Heimdallarchaeota archaeon B3_Heim]|nr:MAG: thioesterase [Candidatus Heimdallarchaeota archaeon B3_Heim]